MNNLIRRKKQQEILSITVCALISYQPIVFFINTVANYFVGEGFIYDTLLCYIILLIFILKSLTIVCKHIKKDVLFLTLFFVFSYLISFLFFDSNRVHMFTSIFDVMANPLYVFIVFSFSGYIFTRYIYNYEILNNYMKKFSFAVVISSIITFILLLNQNSQPQYMVFSYNMLVHTLYLFINFLDNKKILLGTLSLMGILVIFIGGARGPIIIVILTIMIYYFFRKEKLLSKIIGGFFASITSIIVYSNFKLILVGVIDFVNKFGISSRTLQMILNNNFLDSSNRDIIFKEQLGAITFLGKGLYGDRVVTGGYAHNIIIELLVQYGFVLGFLIIILIVYIIGNGVFSINKRINNLSIIFISSGILKLFLTGSYLNQEPCFYILLGLGMNAIFERRKYKNENSMVNQHNVT